MKKTEIIVTSIEIYQAKDYKVILTVPQHQRHLLEPVQCELVKSTNNPTDKLFTATIADFKAKRTLEANGYMWTLLEKVAKVLLTSKIEVYRAIIERVGVFEIVPIESSKVDGSIQRWQSQGLGWIAEKLDKSKLDGYCKVIRYFGSSVYSRAEMARLIDEIISEARDLGIETITPAEKEKMLNKIKEKL